MTRVSDRRAAAAAAAERRRRRAARADAGVVRAHRGDIGAAADPRGLPRRRPARARSSRSPAAGRRRSGSRSSAHGASHVVFGGLLRAVDDAVARPEGAHAARAGSSATARVRETLTRRLARRRSRSTTDLRAAPRPRVRSAAGGQGRAGDGARVDADRRAATDAGRAWTSGDRSFTVSAPGARSRSPTTASRLDWHVPRRTRRVRRGVVVARRCDDPSLVVRGVRGRRGGRVPRSRGGDPRLAAVARRRARPTSTRSAWRCPTAPTTSSSPPARRGSSPSSAATRCGRRDSRCRSTPRIAASTLRVLARLQGDRDRRGDRAAAGQDPARAARRAARDARRGHRAAAAVLRHRRRDRRCGCACSPTRGGPGCREDEVRDAAARAARRAGLDAATTATATATASSTTSTRPATASRTRDGRTPATRSSGATARSPRARSRCARCRATPTRRRSRGADLLDALRRSRAATSCADWAAALKARFASRTGSRRPRAATRRSRSTRDKRPVDTLTSNIGHLLGTGILEPAEEAAVAALLLGPTMSSGFGIRTMSTEAAGYWPLSYHGGSVWTHDTAIIARGMARAGLHDAGGSRRRRAARRGRGIRIPRARAALGRLERR